MHLKGRAAFDLHAQPWYCCLIWRACVRCCRQVRVAPREVLFSAGDDSQAGIFIVVEGQLGVFLEEAGSLCHTNTLRAGESVGDLDVLDGARAQGAARMPPL
jgi:CRP-like cAMP-binding protein